MAELNETALPLPALPGMVPLFEAWAAKAPERVAVVDGGRALSYGEVNAAANRLARRLLDTGDPGVVAIFAGRSAEALVAMLAVLKAGAAYLPLDPGYPAARIELVLADSGARTVLVPGHLRDRLPAFDGTVLETGDDLSSYSASNLDKVIDEADPAYILYTSGSTGRPKGVVVPHRALLNFLVSMENLLDAGEDDAWLALTSLSFDISGLELYLPLVTGARTVIADAGTARDGHRLAELIRREGVTHVQATPSGWRVLLAADYADPAVTALVGGEALTVPLAAELRSRTGRLVNVYGPTETTIWSTAWEVPGDPDHVSIGRPIGNTRIHIVDDRLRPASTGELLIGGLGLAHGYHHRPALTADRFIPDPYGPPGARLYRTGDIVRLHDDGTLHYLGRTDNQIKLRGHRIELGEIESTLETHPAVRQAVAAVHRETLVAYLVGDLPDGPALRAHLADRLPPYMIPQVFVPLETLPLTPNGKVDRKALPAPELAESGAGRVPGTAVERQVTEVFAEVLGLDVVGTGDDFFLLGGHSLLAARAAARITRRLGVEVPVAAFFAHSTVEALAAAVQDLEAPSAPPRPRPAGTAPPLSPAQERLWFLYRLDPQDASYNVYLARRLRGPLDANLLAAALTRVAARHETLRTRFPEAGGIPVAVVEPPAPVPVERLDLAHLPPGEREAEARRLVTVRVNTPIDLAAAPPLRATLIRLAAGEHVLCVVFHHVIGDGWSQNVLLSDLAACYEGRELPALPLQHGDVTYWRREREAAGEGDAALAYWRARLDGLPALDLPADRPRPAGTKRHGAVHRASLPRETVAALEDLGRSTGTTLFMVLLAAYQALLARLSGQHDLAVGTAVAGRDRVELEPLFGFLAETLVLRGDLSGDPAFTDLLVRTRHAVLDAFTHGDVPMERLGGGSGLFRTMLILHTQDDGGTTRLGAATAEVFHAGYTPARFDLTLDAWPDAGGLEMAFGYESSLFDPATIEHLADRFAALLRDVAAAPGARLSWLSRVTGDERERLLYGVNDTALPLPALPGMVPLFEAWAAKAPERVAVVDGGRALSYGEVNAAANRLARRLLDTGDPGVVAIFAGRSAEALVAMLAVLKAGAAYLPLDPGYPAARIELVLADSGARTVLVPGPLRDRLPAFDGTVLETGDGSSAYDPGDLNLSVDPADPAYVLYTSGSTGRPKGVVVPHRALLNFLVSMRTLLDAAEDDAWLALTSLSFDISGLELYLPLITGGRTVIADPGAALDGALLTELIRREGVTHVQATPSGWRVLLAGGYADPAVTALVGGEALSEPLAAELRSRTGRLFNVYGPTETTIWSTAWEVPDEVGRVSIGSPIGNTQVYVLDERLEPVPAGAPGELLIGGLGLAHGYHHRPALTADRFIPDPYGPPGARLYRTGDIVRLHDDGTLHYLGRTDNQIKLRGHRIELGEIESTLETHPAVRQAVAAVHQDRLIAYVAGDAPEPAALRAHLAASLPPYMIPQVFVPLDALPLTPNGKVDRKALPAPGGAEVPLRARGAGTPVPLSPAQERLWFLDYLGGEGAAPLCVAHRLRGPLDEGALAAAVAGVAARHEGLRSRFPGDEGRPLLVVQDTFEPPLARHDLTGRPDAEEEAARLVGACAGEPFDLAAAPPVRMALIRLAPEDHVLCVAAHPIVADAWALGVLVRDLAALYEGRELPAPPVQAGDVTLWRGRREAAAEAGLEHWCGRLAGAPVLDLPLDRPRPPARTGGLVELRLTAELAASLERLGREAGGTLYTVLLAAYQVVLARRAGQTGFMVGRPVSGREADGLEGVVGHLTRHLVVRGDLSGDPGFAELLRRTRAAEREAAEHGDLSPERLVSALGVERDPAQEPLFQTTLTLHEAPPEPGTFGGLEHVPFAPRPPETVYDLALEAWAGGEGLTLAFRYDASLLDAAGVERLAGRYAALLDEVAAAPNRHLSELATPAADRTAGGEPHGPAADGAAGGEAHGPAADGAAGPVRVLDPWGVPVAPGDVGEVWEAGADGVPRATGERARPGPDGRVERLPAAATVGGSGGGSGRGFRPGYVTPRTDAEALVADVWSDLLGVSRVGAADDFFHLGGHSLLAVRAAARLRATVDVDVPIRTFFTHRTVEEFAAAMEDLLLADLEGLSDEEAIRLLDSTEVS
ncbi:amino acid adenylation domain-containing protein [Nonomuraea sp. MTCD27]|uniref:amino acid adenylation domain-containing protein n=1 Tax=Nonomuraea sp. MTCD27 TaxID=1676747 RepID=UPI0035C1E793